MIKRVDHVAIAVNNVEQALADFEKLLGVKAAKVEDVPDQGVKAALIPIGDTEIELIQPIDPNAGVAKFLDSKGEGIHHICIEVEDVDTELKSLEDKGAKLIDKQGRKGLAGKIGFVHPKSLHGILIELAQKV
ncbi:MAG: methylmalonyl-CoA epimerase [Dehalococcoidia bacterium]